MSRAAETARIVTALEDFGLYVNSIYELVRSDLTRPEVIDFLADELQFVEDEQVASAIVRALGVKAAKGRVEQRLITRFKSLPTSVDPLDLRWVIGNTLEILSSLEIEDEMIDLATTKTFGRSREMIVLGLGKIKTDRSFETLVSLLNDEDVQGHAISGLLRLGRREAYSHIEPLRRRKVTWIRKEAEKAVRKFGPKPD